MAQQFLIREVPSRALEEVQVKRTHLAEERRINIPLVGI
jgi:hypothetical protein